MSNYNKISLSQVDIDALSDYVVAKKKLVYRDDTEDSSVVSSNLAQDVEKVAGVLATSIAVASGSDRNTVHNADCLGGLEASAYMTNVQGGSIATKQLKIKQQYGTELKDLRDELYTLRQELAKNGFIEDRGEYSGFTDIFRSARPKHIFQQLADLMPTDSEAQDAVFLEDRDVFDSLDVYDYIVIIADDIQKFTVRQIKEKNNAQKVLVLDSSVHSDIYNSVSGMKLYLSYGINDEGMFKFAKASELSMAAEENHTGLSDDTFKIVKHTFVPNTGFGYSFRIPAEKQGYVTSFEICAKAYGNPGNMICYLLDARDLANFHSPAQAEQDYATAKANKDGSFHFFAASRPLSLSSSYGRRYIRFDFKQDDDTFPLMTQDDTEAIRYVAVIECLECDADNYYDIVFLQHKNAEGRLGDLELNNITYTYTRQPDNSAKQALATDDTINASDMYYHIITRSVLEHEVEPDKEGLYTFHVRTKEDATKARVMLRIRKEGAYVAVTDSVTSTVYNTAPLKIENTDMDNGIKVIAELKLRALNYNPLELRSTEADIARQGQAVIGSNIVTVQSSDEENITLQTPALVNNNDPVYRIGYIVSLKARKVTFENGIETATPYKHFNLPLTTVFKDLYTLDKTASDRLLFEADLFKNEADVTEFNDFVVQIYWSNTEMSPYTDIRKAQMGAIKDIAVSFNDGF